MASITQAATRFALSAALGKTSGAHVDASMGAPPSPEGGPLERDFVANGTAAPIVQFGSWPRSQGESSCPLDWRVLGERSDGAQLLVCTEIVDARSAHDFSGDVNWNQSSLRCWLHSTFFPYAFTKDEQQRIPTMRLTTFDNPEFGTIGARMTTDRVFLLSIREIRHFAARRQIRTAAPTPYAKRLGPASSWWLRSPGGHQFSFARIDEYGAVDSNGFHATLACVGVRPAIVLLPDSSRAASPHGNRSKLQQRHPIFSGIRCKGTIGSAIAYAQYSEASHLLKTKRLDEGQAKQAVRGGWPSVMLIESLMDEGAFTNSDLFHLCIAAADAGEYDLLQHILQTNRIADYQMPRILNAAVANGYIRLAQLAIRCGADPSGYAAAYLPNAANARVATCAVTIDPQGALQLWPSVRKYPTAAKALVDICRNRALATPQDLAACSGLVTLCAKQGYLDALRYVLSQQSAAITPQLLSNAAQIASLHKNQQVVAFLLDRQTEMFGTRTASSDAKPLNASAIRLL